MDLKEAIEQLREVQATLDGLIACLESLRGSGGSNPPPAKRRGRKSMGPEERRLVSERITKYWANRRKLPKPNLPPPGLVP